MAMADTKRNMTVIVCSVVGCIVTCIVTVGSCGIMVGNVQSEVRHHSEEIVKMAAKMESETTKIKSSVDAIIKEQSDIKQKFAFLEGTVITKLDNLQGHMQDVKASINKVERQVDDLIMVDERGE